ncbi:MAG TPA: hypothetical protein PKZ32_21970, partial [Candidatus Melainabacteria bacterium]|nr:hypothetical protein [Candidatus Melainabacteria bacterium]
VMEHGLWYARSQQFILSMPFQTLTWMRIVGGSVFVLGGVMPLTYFVLSRHKSAERVLAEPQAESTAVLASHE